MTFTRKKNSFWFQKELHFKAVTQNNIKEKSAVETGEHEKCSHIQAKNN